MFVLFGLSHPAHTGSLNRTPDLPQRQRPNHPCRRSRHFRIKATPQMQAVWVAVHVLRFWRVELHNAVLGVPKESLDIAHFVPRRHAIFERHGNVLPSFASRCDYGNYRSVRQAEHERAISARSRCKGASSDPELLREYDHFTPRQIGNGHRGRPSSLRILRISRRAAWVGRWRLRFIGPSTRKRGKGQDYSGPRAGPARPPRRLARPAGNSSS